MNSRLHVCLLADADTAIETEAACKLGPRLRIGDGRDAIDLTLPFEIEDTLAFLRRLSDTVTDLSAAITEHGTAHAALTCK